MSAGVVDAWTLPAPWKLRTPSGDSVTATEVTVMGPASASRADLERLAAQKLRARLARDAGETR